MTAEIGTGPLDDAYLQLKHGLGTHEDIELLLEAQLLSVVREWGSDLLDDFPRARDRLLSGTAPWARLMPDEWDEICASGDIGRLHDVPDDYILVYLAGHDSQLDASVRRLCNLGAWMFVRDVHVDLAPSVQGSITLPQRTRRRGPRPPAYWAKTVTWLQDRTASADATSSTPSGALGEVPWLTLNGRPPSAPPWGEDWSPMSVVFTRPYGTVFHRHQVCNGMLNGQAWGRPGTPPEDGYAAMASSALIDGYQPCLICFPRAWFDEGRDIDRERWRTWPDD